MKKLLSVLLAAIIAAATLAFTVSAADDFEITDGVLVKYNGSDPVVVIPDGVVSLGDTAFENNSLIEKVYVPDSVVSMGYSAFHNCESLTELHLGSSVSKLGDNVIWESFGLTTLTVDENNPYLTAVDNVIYSKDLSTLVLFPDGYSGEFVIPDHVTKINDYSFFGCAKLTALTIPDSVTEIGSHGLWGLSGVESLILPGGLSKIAEKTFCECTSLKELYIPDGVREIEFRAFWDCKALKTVHLPDSLITLGEDAFYKCPLSSVTIPAGTEAIDSRAFIQCTSLEKIIFEGNAPQNTDKRFIYKCDNAKIYYNSGASGFDVAPFSSLGKVTFSDCETGHYYRLESPGTPENTACGDHLKDLYKCARCGDEMLKITGAVKEHEIVQYEAKDPTCTEPGNAAYEACLYCDYTTCEVIPALGHDFGEDGVAEACLRCGEKNPAYAPPVPQISFTDVKPGAYYADAVAWALASGITKGTSETTFSPGKGCTRAQVVTFLWRAAGEPEPTSGKNPFSDVRAKDYYYKAVLWAVENDITTGTSPTNFSPSSTCTRAQIVTFLWRYNDAPEPDGADNPFTDVKRSAYFTKAVLWAVENDITTGTSPTKFSPSSTCTRGQVVTFLYRSFSAKER